MPHIKFYLQCTNKHKANHRSILSRISEYCRAVFSHEYLSSTLLREAPPICSRVFSSRSNLCRLSRNESTSSGLTNNPVKSSTTSSSLPAILVATTGNPLAIASSTALGIPSWRDGNRNKFERCYERARSSC